MPLESQLQHRYIRNTNLPYITNSSPIDSNQQYVSGSKDILTSIAGYAERRPGFADTLGNAAFHNLQRIFTWDRFDGTFYIMACDLNASGFAQVFQMQSGLTTFTSIFTDTSATPFDFVVSNNTVYFSNANTAKKWDPVNGISNWGISIGAVSNSVGPNGVGTGANFSGGTWANPTRITANDGSFATQSLTGISGGTAVSTGYVAGTNAGFAIPATSTISGIQIDVKGKADALSSVQLGVQLLKAGALIGTSKILKYLTTTNTLYTFGGAGDLWGTSWTPSDINSANFGAAINFAISFTSATRTTSLDYVQITIFGTGGPTVVVNAGAGTMTATAGYQYVFSYGNSNTGHISSPTPVSASTGVFTNKLEVDVTLTSSTDPQVNQIRVFRTTDGGGGTYFELPNSPFANANATIADNAADTGLQVTSVAPTATFNDPPTPFQSPQYFSGRIWGFVGNQVWFSGLEEINQGVPEESFPSGVGGNYWSFDEPVKAEAVAGSNDAQTLAVLCGGRLYGINGNTLDTFRRFSISNRRGCRNLETTSSLGGMTAWLDSSNQIWATNGASLQELSTQIRPDLVGINPALCSMTFHVAGRFHWLVFSTGTLLYVYDMDMEQWMPPWTFATSYIFSGETSAGNYQLLAADTTKILQLNISAFNDDGVPYQPVLKTNLLPVIPDYGGYAGGAYDEPSRTGVPWTFQVTNNGQSLSDFLILTDEDPTTGTYNTIATSLKDTADAYNRTNGTDVKQLVYETTGPSSRWVSMQIVLQNMDQVDNIYELFLAYKALGGR